MPGHYGGGKMPAKKKKKTMKGCKKGLPPALKKIIDKKKKTGTKKVSKGLAALAKKRPKVAAAIMKNKTKT